MAATITATPGTIRMNGRVIQERGLEVVIFDGYDSVAVIRDGVEFLPTGFVGNFTIVGDRLIDATGTI